MALRTGAPVVPVSGLTGAGVDKLMEAARNPKNHRYSLSRGIPKLRLAICNWYKARYDIDLDPDAEAIVTIGSKEGIAHLALATLERPILAVEMPGRTAYEIRQILRLADPAGRAA